MQTDSTIFEFIQKGASDGMWYWDMEHPENEWMNPQFWQTLGYDPREKQHSISEWQALIFPEDLKRAEEHLSEHLQNPDIPYDQVLRYRHADGHTVWVRCRGMAIRDANNHPSRMLGVHHDITQQMQALEELSSLSQRFEVAVDSAQIGVWDLNIQTQELHWDERMFQLYKVDPETFSNGYESWSKTVHPTDLEKADKAVQESIASGKKYNREFRIIWPNGEIRHLHAYGKIIHNAQGEAERMIGVNFDVTREKRLQEKINKLVITDYLTGIGNRRHFMKEASKDIARAQRYSIPLSLFIMDIDDFKKINDTYGHDVGDLVIKKVATLCAGFLRETDLFCRYGGEEFAGVLTQSQLEDAEEVCEKLRHAVAASHVITRDNQTIEFTVSIGLTQLEQHRDVLGDLIRRADQALYIAKNSGKNQVIAEH
ncbi:sensor domain-containing diguanylate cyclase [Thiomicrorhabdus sp. 6S3-12]|uniref:GGDEF domain-containing protein n=1 Tax=Thiomicrorhabdus sp. 6S3-12 TaxID=2819681 RepID=UPI001AACF764|nr:diguanylate cyclase [Thiomicrorhabdus sp. 6S3-12]